MRRSVARYSASSLVVIAALVSTAVGVPLAGCAGTSGEGSGGAASGGQTNTGGAGPTGGSAGAGGGEPLGVLEPKQPDLAGKVEASCQIEITSAQLSEVIGTVGIVEFSVDLPGVNEAVIEFGLTTDYGLLAPVALSAENRTLLLGMTTTSEYHYRVLAVSDEAYCIGPDQTIVTGSLPAGGPSHLTPELGGSSVPRTPGFFLTTQFNGTWVYIFDQDGRIVWFYDLPFGQASRALMSWDGSRMYAHELNVGRNEMGRFFEVMMDGSSPRTVNLPTSHHDFTVTPTGSVAYIRKTPDSTCDSLYEHPLGASDSSADRLIFDVETAFPSGGGEPILQEQSCHTNSLDYNVRDGSFTASDLAFSAYFKVSGDGELEWVLGSQDTTLSGELVWNKQHGHHFLAGDVLLFFNNSGVGDSGSLAREVGIDLAASSASFLPFSYASGEVTATMGDVQRLPGGNTVVFYSNAGIVHEVDPDGALVQSFKLATGSGYGSHRPALYGTPPE